MTSDMRSAFEEAANETNGSLTAAIHRPARRRASQGENNGAGNLGFDPVRLATGLGWFSIGLGLMEFFAPGRVAQTVGMPETETNQRTLRLFGLRELASGIGILSQPEQSAPWVKSRVAGDAMDLAALGNSFASEGSNRSRLLVATAAVIAVTALDVICSEQLSKESAPPSRRKFTTWLERKLDRRVHVTRSVTVNRPPEELYAFWRRLENLPRIMPHLESVRVLDDRRSHWKAKAPLGFTVEWDSEITDDEPNRRLAWRSLPDATVRNSGEVRFEPLAGNRGMVVHLDLKYDPPGGRIGATFAKLFGRAPEQQLQQALRDFKQIIEVGEVTLSDASAKGWGAGQPPDDSQVRSIADRQSVH